MCDFAAKMDAMIAEYCRDGLFSGSLRVTVKDRVIYERHMGEGLSGESMYTFYSLSKPFCAMGLLKLRDRGLVDIDAHPGSYVPEAQGFDGRVTIRQMLHHISGLPDCEQDTAFAEVHRPGTPALARQHVRELTALPMLFEPGTAAKYENINFLLCALVIENVTGLKYADYMRREVFEPLGMKTALVDVPGIAVDRMVQGYELCDGVKVPVERSRDWLLGAGDIIGTVDDAYCLNKAIKHGLILSEATWREVLTPSLLNGMGMGCTVSQWHGKRRITHNGGHRGFRTLHIQLPEEDFDIILLSNCGWGNARSDFAEAVYAAWFGDGSDAGAAVSMDAGYAKG